MHSHFWYATIEVKKLFYSCYQRIVGDGKKTRFWEDCLYVNHFLDFTTYLIVITDLEESRELEQDTTGNKGDGACFPWQITTTGRNGCWSRYLG